MNINITHRTAPYPYSQPSVVSQRLLSRSSLELFSVMTIPERSWNSQEPANVNDPGKLIGFWAVPVVSPVSSSQSLSPTNSLGTCQVYCRRPKQLGLAVRRLRTIPKKGLGKGILFPNPIRRLLLPPQVSNPNLNSSVRSTRQLGPAAF